MKALVAFCLALAVVGCASTGQQVDPRRSGSAVDRISPDRAAESNTRLGVAYLERGEIQVAMEKLELALSHDPEHVPAHLALAIVYQSIDRDQKALEHLKTAVRLAPGDGGAHNSYAVLLCQVGRFDEADRQFRAALEDPFYPTPSAALANAGYCARRAGRLQDAERYLRQALELEPANRQALYNLAEVSLEQDKLMSARAFIQRLEASGPLDPGSLMLGWRIEREIGDIQTAERYATALMRQYPESPQASMLRQQN